MSRGLALALSLGVGGLVGLQAPVNGVLGRRIGTLPAATLSFVVGGVALGLLALLFASPPPAGGGLRGTPWYAFVGGLLGACFVATSLVTVRVLGAGGVTAAVISGQLAMSVLVDRLGILGLPERPLTVARLVGVGLLGLGVTLIVRG